MPSFSADKNENTLAHSRKVSLVKIERQKNRQTIQTQTLHKRRNSQKYTIEHQKKHFQNF